jgi:hypothetical protein
VIERMSQPEASGEGVANIRRILVNPSPPKAAHLMGWTRVGDQVLLEVGHFDLLAVHQQVSGETPPKALNIDWLVTDRFILNVEAAERFIAATAELAGALEAYKSEQGDDATNG